MIKKIIKLYNDYWYKYNDYMYGYHVKKLLEDDYFDKTMTELENSINEVDCYNKKYETNFSNRFKDLMNKASKYEK